MGLALDVDLADLAGVPSRKTEPAEPDADEKPTIGFGVLHPGLGTTVAELRANVKVGTHVFVEVDTTALHAYPVE